MPYYKAVIMSTVTETVLVKAKNLGEARELIDDDDERVVVIGETVDDFEIEPGSLHDCTNSITYTEQDNYEKKMKGK